MVSGSLTSSHELSSLSSVPYSSEPTSRSASTTLISPSQSGLLPNAQAQQPISTRMMVVHRLPQPFFCLGELTHVDPSGQETYTAFIVAISLVDHSVWLLFHSRDREARWSSAMSSDDPIDDDLPEEADFIPLLDKSWAQLPGSPDKMAAIKVATDYQSWTLGDPTAELRFLDVVPVGPNVVPELVPVRSNMIPQKNTS